VPRFRKKGGVTWCLAFPFSRHDAVKADENQRALRDDYLESCKKDQFPYNGYALVSNHSRVNGSHQEGTGPKHPWYYN